MIAAHLKQWSTVPVLADTPVPDLAPSGEVLVEMEAAAVTHLDLTLTSGSFAYRPALPFTPGTAGVGRVVQGEGLVGQRVLVRGAGVGLERSGTWAEQVAVPLAGVRTVPETISAALAATCYSPLSTSWAAVGPVGQVGPGDRVLVTGASGGVGSLAVQLAARAGAHVVAAVRSEEKAAGVPDAAGEVLVGRDPQALAEACAEDSIDVLVDTVGGDIVPALLNAMRPGGRAVLIGYVAGRTLSVDLPTLLARDVTLVPVNMVRRQVPDDVFHSLLDQLGDGRLHLPTTTIPFADLGEAIGARGDGTVSGAVAVTM